MAKPLREAPPSSSVARLLDRDAAARAIAAAPPTPIRQARTAEAVVTFPQPTAPTGEPANTKREFVLSPSTDETFSQLVELYCRTTRTRLSSSHVLRAILKGVAHCMDCLEHEARKQLGPQKLPSNARGREGERIRFEERIARAFVAGVRAASAYENDQE